MSNIDDEAQEFDDLDMPSEQFDAAPVEGMPDPTAKSPLTDGEAVPSEPAEEDGRDEQKPSREKTVGLLSQVAQASPYTVMLALSVLAIGIALLCLILEWSGYAFNRKPPANLSINRVDNARHPERSEGYPAALRKGKGDRRILCEAPCGPLRQNAPVPFSRPSPLRGRASNPA